MIDPVYVIGATGRSGLALCRSLLANGVAVLPVVRNPAKWAVAGLVGTPRQADLRQPEALHAALAGARRIVSCAHARHAAAIIAAAPEPATLVLLGSTRKFTRWPDAHGDGVLTGEAALLGAGRSGVILHPTMIYGAEGEDNVQRLARLLRRLPMMPLPGGGRFLVQPVHQSDVTRCLCAALTHQWQGANSMVIAGPTALTYANFVRAVAAAAGLRKPLIVPFPAGPLVLAARLTQHLAALPTVRPEEIRRLLEDKAFDITLMRTQLGIEPIPLAQGLALTFARPRE